MSTLDLKEKSPLIASNTVEDHSTSPDMNQIKQLHSKLLTRYIEVLNKISIAPRRIKFTNVGWDDPWRYVASLYAESHIKTKLNELSVAYLYLSSSLPVNEPETKDAREWLRSTIDECRRVAETLQSTTNLRGFLTLAWPYLLPVIATLLRISNPNDTSAWFAAFSSRDVLVGVLIVLYVPIVYASFIAFSTFSYKRSLFLTRKSTMHSEMADLESNIVGSPENIYFIEDELFGILNRGKKRERALDIAALALALLMFGLPGLFGKEIWGLEGQVCGGFLIIAGLLIGIRLSRKRKWW